MENIHSVQADTCVARLTPITRSPSLLPAFEDTWNSVQATHISLLRGHLPGLCLGDYSGVPSVTSL